MNIATEKFKIRIETKFCNLANHNLLHIINSCNIDKEKSDRDSVFTYINDIYPAFIEKINSLIMLDVFDGAGYEHIPSRIGTSNLYEILERICRDYSEKEDMNSINNIAETESDDCYSDNEVELVNHEEDEEVLDNDTQEELEYETEEDDTEDTSSISEENEEKGVNSEDNRNNSHISNYNNQYIIKKKHKFKK